MQNMQTSCCKSIMDFEDSLFDEFKGKERTTNINTCYQAKIQENNWFMSNSAQSETDNPGYILKHKADYYFACGKFGDASKIYNDLLTMIPSSNTVLYQEISESLAICFQKLKRFAEAKNIIEDLRKEVKTVNGYLWIMLSDIYKFENKINASIFALQYVLKQDNEVAGYWVRMAQQYTCLSQCSKSRGNEENNDTKVNTRTSTTVNCNHTELTDYVANHRTCFCALCSLLIARFYYQKYPLQSTQFRSIRSKDLEKVDQAIDMIRCIPPNTLTTIRTLLHEKFAKTVDHCEFKVSPKTEDDDIDPEQDITERILEFEKHWFPLL